MRVHERVQIGITVCCSPAEPRHEGEECQEAQQPQQEQQPCPLEQSQWPLPGPSPAPEQLGQPAQSRPAAVFVIITVSMNACCPVIIPCVIYFPWGVCQGFSTPHVYDCVLLGTAWGGRRAGSLAIESRRRWSAGSLLLHRGGGGCGKSDLSVEQGGKVQTADGGHHLPLKLDQSEKSEELRGSGSGLITSSIRGRPSPARAQLTVASFSLSAEATGPARLAGGKMGPLQLGHW